LKLEDDEKHWEIIKDQKKDFRGSIATLEKEYRDIEYQYEIKF